MITILVVDDEKLIRARINKILTESIAIPITVLEAKNGEDALAVCNEENPDIVITDIRMPKVDGIELMKNLSQKEDKPAIIVLSGFDDFSYAKEAITCGALSYILKPVDKNELITAVNNAITTLNREEKKRNEQIIKNIAEDGHLDSITLPESCKFENGFFVLYAQGKKGLQVFQRILQPVSYYVLEQKRDFVCFVIPKEALYLIKSDSEIAHFKIGMSEHSENITSLKASKNQAFTAFLQNFFIENATQNASNFPNVDPIIEYSSLEGVSDFSLVDASYERCIGRIEIATADEIKKGIDKMMDFSAFTEKQKGNALYFMYNKIINNLFKRFPGSSDNDMYLHLKSIMIESIWFFATLEEWKQCVTDYVVYLSVLLQKNTHEHPFITKAIAYLNKHYTENINMAVVANAVSANYTWFSEKFKEHTGLNFNEYIKRMRIDEAKRLLAKGCYKTYEVSERAGFGDVKYFMKTFKVCTGLTPGEYKQSVAKFQNEE